MSLNKIYQGRENLDKDGFEKKFLESHTHL